MIVACLFSCASMVKRNVFVVFPFLVTVVDHIESGSSTMQICCLDFLTEGLSSKLLSFHYLW